jgi:sulfatase maturation enzyme AslB (radical SAM superfamily)
MAGRQGCSTCWARALCGGGCNTHAIQYNRDIRFPYRLECEMIQWRYRLAMWIIAQCPELVKAFRSAVRNQEGEGRDSGHVMLPLWAYLERYRVLARS